MSRRSRRRRQGPNPEASAHHYSPSRSLTPLLASLHPLSPGPWLDVEDRRRHHPLGSEAPAKTYKGTPARIQSKNKFSRPHKMAGFSVPGVPKKLEFKDPKKVLVCVRREQRKEVLFAKRKTGKGGAAKRRRLTPYSKVSC